MSELVDAAVALLSETIKDTEYAMNHTLSDEHKKLCFWRILRYEELREAGFSEAWARKMDPASLKLVITDAMVRAAEDAHDAMRETRALPGGFCRAAVPEMLRAALEAAISERTQAPQEHPPTT